MLATLGQCRAFPEIPAVWQRLSARYTLAVASTTDAAPLLADLARAGLHTPHIFTSKGLRAYKPHPAFYRAVLQAMGLSPARALFVGDSLLDDVEGPSRAGMKTGWVNRAEKAFSGKITPDYRLRNLDDLLTILL